VNFFISRKHGKTKKEKGQKEVIGRKRGERRTLGGTSDRAGVDQSKSGKGKPQSVANLTGEQSGGFREERSRKM